MKKVQMQNTQVKILSNDSLFINVEIFRIKILRFGKIVKSFIFFLGIAAVSACQHSPNIVELPETEVPSEELEKLANEVQMSLDKQIDILSPKSFFQAELSLKIAREEYQKNPSSKKILFEIARGQAFLSQANEIGNHTKDRISEIILARNNAIGAQALSAFPSEFQKAEFNLKDLTSEIEKNNFKNLETKRGQLLDAYLNLELAAIKQHHIEPIKEKLAAAIKEGAKQFAPRSLAATENKIHHVDAFITSNRHDSEQINELAEEAFSSANHLLKITLEVRKLRGIALEEIALDLESKSEEEQNALAQLSKQASTIEEKEYFHSLFEDARNAFQPWEADVFQRGNTLIIRLHSLRFPISQATFSGRDFAILEKLRNVVKELNPLKVKIEGHTDSSGTRETNYRVSLARANAVADYLIETRTTSRHSIETVGMGEEKPIASNKTKDGRAKNRRVDIEITPRQDIEDCQDFF